MQVAVWHFESSDDQRNTITVKNLFLCLGNLLGNGKAMLRDVIWQICPLIYFNTWNNKEVSTRNGVNGHKSNAHIVGVHECAGQFACNDASKY